jgi:hypothetical protein
MKTLLPLAFALLLASCDEPVTDYQVTVALSGDPGLAFTGWYVTTASPDTVTASGTTPRSWTLVVRRGAGDCLSAQFTQADPGTGTIVGVLIVESDTVAADTTNPSEPTIALSWAPES